jgi:hypothetical protein
MRNKDAYVALLDKSIEIDWPVHHRDDLLKHDKRCLIEDLPEGGQFAWLARECGTELFLPGSEAALAMLSYWERQDHSRVRAFWWDGKRLTEIPLHLVRINLEIAAPYQPLTIGA